MDSIAFHLELRIRFHFMYAEREEAERINQLETGMHTKAS